MFFKTSTEKKVNELLQSVELRGSKIKESIEIIDNQIGELESKITDLMDKYVSLEIDGKSAELKEIDKSINQTRLQIESLKGKKEAYSKLATDDRHVKEAIPQILESARSDMEERYGKVKKKIADREALKEKIKGMEGQLEELEREISQLRVDKEVKVIKPLLKYIETREVEQEESYIIALLHNSPKEIVEQYLKKNIPWRGPRSTMVIKELNH